MSYITESGIPGMGKIPWGSHFCQLYAYRQDLVESLVSYFVAGLRNNERCIWITSDFYDAKDAETDLRKAMPRLEGMMKEGRIQIRNFHEWSGSVTSSSPWLKEEQDALAESYQGLRMAGDMGFIERPEWDTFMAYENALHRTFTSHRILALCNYNLHKCQPTDIFEVIRNHLFTLCRRDGYWEVLDTGACFLVSESAAKFIPK